jgi:predicted nucleic acid-binding Zn ribbon protein
MSCNSCKKKKQDLIQINKQIGRNNKIITIGMVLVLILISMGLFVLFN